MPVIVCRKLYFLSLVLVFTLVSEMANASTIFRAFANRYSVNTTGDIFLAGNTLLSCATSTACTNARNGTSTGANLNNNNLTMARVDVDASMPTITGLARNSSIANLNLPAGSTVLWAGLYWGGVSGSGQRNQATFKTPASAYTNLTATQLDANGTEYHAFRDVTSLVQAGGSGNYHFGNARINVGAGLYAGWSLVVVVQNPSLLLRNLRVYDGYALIDDALGASIVVPGLTTPLSGTVTTRVGAISYEGDRGTTGDQLLINGTAISDAANPANNVANSSINRLGSNVSTKSPNYINQLGYDIDYIENITAIPNGANSATFRFTSTGDVYYPGVLTTAIQLYSPNFTDDFTKSVTDLNGGAFKPNDELQFTLQVSNTGDDGGTNAEISDSLPAGLTYVPNSITISGPAGSSNLTDNSGDDTAEYTAANKTLKFRIGTGANSTTGGLVSPGQSFTITFRATIDSSTAGQTITNTAIATYNGQTLATAFSSEAEVDIPVEVATAPTFAHQKNLLVIEDPMNGTSNPKFIPGALADYTLKLTNTGNGQPDANSLVLTDSLATNAELFVGDYSGGAPFQFVDGTPSSSLNCAFTTLSDLADCIDFSTDNGTSWSYVPTAPFDPSVNAIRFKPAGSFASSASSPFPSAEFKFRVKVK